MNYVFIGVAGIAPYAKYGDATYETSGWTASYKQLETYPEGNCNYKNHRLVGAVTRQL